MLAINAGSSSIKFALYGLQAATLHPVARGQVEGIGTAPHFIARDQTGAVAQERTWPDPAASHEELLGTLLDFVDHDLGADSLRVVGHRIVHGGESFDRPVRIDADVMRRMEALIPLAPLHQPHNLSPIRAIAAARPRLPQVACFDTAFHRTMPAVATRFALPARFAAAGVRRYGFHGISYEFIAGRLRELAPDLAAGRVIVAHLGNGASLCAMRDGRSVDTTMGFTALDGLVMGTRCGTLDPGVVLHLVKQMKLSAEQVEDLLYRQSGLLGVSGISGDMRKLLASDATPAREAIELFVFRLARETGALISSLGGLDGLIFTAGIGEHASPIRAAACEHLSWLGIHLNPAANDRGDTVISEPDSRVSVRVIPTDEEIMIARHALTVAGD